MIKKYWFLGIVGITVFLCVSSVLAEPLDSYCIVQNHEKWQPAPHNLYPFGPRNKHITFSVKDELFHIAVPYRNGINLIRGDEEKPYMFASAMQDEGGHIDHLVLKKNGWLWIDGSVDYMAHINLDNMPPTISPPEKISDLRRGPCAWWGGDFGHCLSADGFYSTVLGRIFVNGYRQTFWGSKDLVSLEIIDGKRRVLRQELQGAHLVFDPEIPQLNGVLFRGNSGEPLLYDGSSVTNLLKDHPIQYHEEITPEQMQLQWHLQKLLYSKRIFLVSSGGRKHPRFLFEINNDLTLTEISMLAVQPPDGFLRFFVFPNEKRLWVVSRYGVLTEVDGQLRYVALAKLSYIGGPGGSTHQKSDGNIRFTVKKKSDESLIHYSLVRSSSTDSCQATLNINKPILLGDE